MPSTAVICCCSRVRGTEETIAFSSDFESSEAPATDGNAFDVDPFTCPFVLGGRYGPGPGSTEAEDEAVDKDEGPPIDDVECDEDCDEDASEGPGSEYVDAEPGSARPDAAAEGSASAEAFATCDCALGRPSVIGRAGNMTRSRRGEKRLE